MCCSVLKQHELTTAFSCHNSHIVKQIIKRVVEQWGVRFMHLIIFHWLYKTEKKKTVLVFNLHTVKFSVMTAHQRLMKMMTMFFP